jgi:O-succinylbenzoic acid--CoA ligase
MRELRVVEAEPDRLLEALHVALTGSGAAIFPVAPGTPAPFGLPPTVPQRIAVVIETSGSTGRPKRVMLSASALLQSAAAAQSSLEGPGQWLLALPGHWIAGLGVLVRSLAMQTVPVVDAGNGMHPDAFAAAAAALDPTQRHYCSLVPPQLERLLGDPESIDALRGMNRVLLGGQSVHPQLLQRAHDAGVHVTTTYGASETCGGCVWDGRAIGDAVVSIVEGRIHLRGSMLADGYLDDPEREAESFVELPGHDGAPPHRCYRTDDAGWFDGDRLVVTGRLDDVIVSGGVKLDLVELTAFVSAWPEVGDVAVVALQDSIWGQVPGVVVTGSIDEDAMHSAAVAALGLAAGWMRVVRLDRIPTSPTGKRDRAAIIAAFGRGN